MSIAYTMESVSTNIDMDKVRVPGSQTKRIIGSDIDVITWHQILNSIDKWGEEYRSRYICVCNVHSVVTANKSADLQEAINNADIATPDGMPLVWLIRHGGFPAQERIYGPDIMWKYCAMAAAHKRSIYLFGTTEATLGKLRSALETAFPGLKIAGSYAPPFRPLTVVEDETIINQINSSGANVVFVGLGCPKQELWMAEHRGRINAVMIGVGAAFDFHAGTTKTAPKWMQSAGLEWLFRLLSEPRRLWKRYLVTNTKFILYILGAPFRRKVTGAR